MQVFRLVDPGRVDRVIAFDSLPEAMLSNLKRGTINGLPSNWYQYMGVKRGDNGAMPFYVVDFRTINRDKEKWQEIGNYVRRSTHKDFRLLDKLEDMAKPMSVDSYSSLDLEPEDIPVVPIVKEVEEEEIPKVAAKVIATVIEKVVEVKKRGRPKKEAIPA